MRVLRRLLLRPVIKDERGYFIVLDATPFYPQGGGQPSDQGHLILEDRKIPIVAVRLVEGEIRHYTDQDYGELCEKKVMCEINGEKRILHSKLHTAGHLLSNIVESLYPSYKAIKGRHFPGECYVEFRGKNSSCGSIDVAVLNQKIAEVIADNKSLKARLVDAEKIDEICPDLPYRIPPHSSIRVVSIGDFPDQPCGGTHVETTLELEGIVITKFKMKDNTLKINYTLEV